MLQNLQVLRKVNSAPCCTHVPQLRRRTEAKKTKMLLGTETAGINFASLHSLPQHPSQKPKQRLPLEKHEFTRHASFRVRCGPGLRTAWRSEKHILDPRNSLLPYERLSWARASYLKALNEQAKRSGLVGLCEILSLGLDNRSVALPRACRDPARRRSVLGRRAVHGLRLPTSLRARNATPTSPRSHQTSNSVRIVPLTRLSQTTSHHMMGDLC